MLLGEPAHTPLTAEYASGLEALADHAGGGLHWEWCVSEGACTAGHNEFNQIIAGTHARSMHLYDLSGRLVFSTTINSKYQTIDLSGLQKGIYVYMMKDDNGQIIDQGKIQKN